MVCKYIYGMQGCNHGKNLGATSAMVGRICPPGCNRVKVSQNLGLTAVAPVAPVDTSLVDIDKIIKMGSLHASQKWSLR